MPAPERRGAADRASFHHHEACPLEVLDEAPRDDLRHEFIGIVDALTPFEPQGESESGGQVVGRRGREGIG